MKKTKIKLSERILLAEADASVERLTSAIEEKFRNYESIREGYELLRKKNPNHIVLDMIIFNGAIPQHTEQFNEKYREYIKQNTSDSFEDRYRRADEMHLTEALRALKGFEVSKT